MLLDLTALYPGEVGLRLSIEHIAGAREDVSQRYIQVK